MTISEIKSKFNLTNLSLNYSLKDGVRTEWLRCWINEERISISIHEDLAKQIKEDSSLSTLSLQGPEMREAEQGSYTSYRIVAYNADLHL